MQRRDPRRRRSSPSSSRAVGRRRARRSRRIGCRMQMQMTDDRRTQSSCRRSYHCRDRILTTEEGWEEKDCSTSTSRCRGLPPSACPVLVGPFVCVCCGEGQTKAQICLLFGRSLRSFRWQSRLHHDSHEVIAGKIVCRIKHKRKQHPPYTKN